MANNDIDQFLLLHNVANQTGTDPNELRAILSTESSGNPNAISPKGAQGLMQLMPGTAKDMGVTNPMDPVQNMIGGAKYWGQLKTRYGGDIDKALAANNWGMGNVDRKGMANMPPETRNYITHIKGLMGQSLPAETQPQTSGPTAAPGPDIDQFMKNWKEPVDPKTQSHLTDYLPQALGAAGGMIGGAGGAAFGLGFGGIPGAVGGAALGGAAGEAFKELLDRFVYGKGGPDTSTGAALNIGKNAAIEGGSELAGQAVGGLMEKTAVGMYRRILKPSVGAVKRTNTFVKGRSLIGGSNEIAETLLKNKVALSESGLSKAMGLQDAAAGAARQAAVASPERFSISELIPDLQKKIASLRSPGSTVNVAGDAAAPYEELLRNLMAHPSRVNQQLAGIPGGNMLHPTTTPTLSADQLFSMLQDAYKNTKGRYGVQAVNDTRDAYKLLASTERKALGRVNGIAKPLAEQSRLLPAIDALNQGVKRFSNNNGVSMMDLLALTGAGSMAAGTGDVKGPAAAAAVYTALRRPSTGGFIARRLYQSSGAAPVAAHGVSALIHRLMQTERAKTNGEP